MQPLAMQPLAMHCEMLRYSTPKPERARVPTSTVRMAPARHTRATPAADGDASMHRWGSLVVACCRNHGCSCAARRTFPHVQWWIRRVAYDCPTSNRSSTGCREPRAYPVSPQVSVHARHSSGSTPRLPVKMARVLITQLHRVALPDAGRPSAAPSRPGGEGVLDGVPGAWARPCLRARWSPPAPGSGRLGTRRRSRCRSAHSLRKTMVPCASKGTSRALHAGASPSRARVRRGRISVRRARPSRDAENCDAVRP
jgi:hypothetical protein